MGGRPAAATALRGVQPGAGQVGPRGWQAWGRGSPVSLPPTRGHWGWRRRGQAGKSSLGAPERGGRQTGTQPGVPLCPRARPHSGQGLNHMRAGHCLHGSGPTWLWTLPWPARLAWARGGKAACPAGEGHAQTPQPQGRGLLCGGHRRPAASCQGLSGEELAPVCSVLLSTGRPSSPKPRAPAGTRVRPTGQKPPWGQAGSGTTPGSCRPAVPQGPDSAAGRVRPRTRWAHAGPAAGSEGGPAADRRAAGVLTGQAPGTGRGVGSDRPLLTRCPRTSPRTGSPATPVGKGLHSQHPALGPRRPPGKRGLGTLACWSGQ